MQKNTHEFFPLFYLCLSYFIQSYYLQVICFFDMYAKSERINYRVHILFGEWTNQINSKPEKSA